MVFQDWRFFRFVVCAEFFTVVNMGKLENSNLLFCFRQVRVCGHKNVCTFLNQSFQCGKNTYNSKTSQLTKKMHRYRCGKDVGAKNVSVFKRTSYLVNNGDRNLKHVSREKCFSTKFFAFL